MDAHARIARTFARYCHRCDDGEWDAFEELFERDAVFTVLGDDHIGRGSIRAYIEAAMPPEVRGKLFLGQSDVEVDEEQGLAEGVTDFVFLDKARQVTQAGRYHDRLRRGPDGEWRFTTREIRFL